MNSNELAIDARELSEIKHCLLYHHECGHGTVGHNLLNLVAKLAKDRGFLLEYHGHTDATGGFVSVIVPDDVTVEETFAPNGG